MKKTMWLITLLLVASASEAGAKAAPTCATREISAGYTYEYCIRTGDRSKNEDIVYFFHGLWGNARSWFVAGTRTQLLEKRWAELGYNPTVVTISFGEIWLLVNTEEHPLLSALQNEMMPFLESQVGGIRQGRRHLIGMSMGGFNSAQASLQLPGSFSRVALLCPAITTVGPYSSAQDIERYIQRTKAQRSRVELMLDISRDFFKDQAEWDRHDPLLLLGRYSGAVKPTYLVSTGLQDEFGFQEGSAEFVKQAKAVAMKARWVPVQGGHCAFDRESVARFIADKPL